MEDERYLRAKEAHDNALETQKRLGDVSYHSNMLTRAVKELNESIKELTYEFKGRN